MGAIKNITDLTIKLMERKSARRFTNEVLKIQSLAAEVQSEHAAIVERDSQLVAENQDLKRRNKELEEQISVGRKVEFHYEAYWVQREDGSLDGPFSPQLWDSERKLMRLQLSRRGSASFEFVCGKSQKSSVVPLSFMIKHRVWSQEELRTTELN